MGPHPDDVIAASADQELNITNANDDAKSVGSLSESESTASLNSSRGASLSKDEVSALLAALTRPPPPPQGPGFVSCISTGMNGLDSAHLAVGSEEPALKRDRPTLFAMRYCPWSQRVLLVANKKGIDIDVINIDPTDVPSWYLAKNPLGEVPVMQQGDFVAADSANLVNFLEEKYPDEKLSAETPEDRAKDNSFLRVFEKKIPPKFAILMTAKDPTTFSKTWSSLVDDLTWVESELVSRGAFLLGGRFVRCIDYCVLPWFERLQALEHLGLVKMPWDKIPNLSTWMARMANDPSVKSLRVPVRIMAETLQSFRDGKPKLDLANLKVQIHRRRRREEKVDFHY